MIVAIGKALRRSLAVAYDGAKHRPNFRFACVGNLAIDATNLINLIVEHRTERSVAIKHNSGMASVFSKIARADLPRLKDKRATHISAVNFIECMIRAAQTVFDEYTVADYEERAVGEFEGHFKYRRLSLDDRIHSSETAYYKLTHAFETPMFEHGEIRSGGVLLDEREFNLSYWTELSKEHPYTAMGYGLKVGCARLIATAVKNMKHKRIGGLPTWQFGE